MRGTQVIECPRCTGRFMFFRSTNPLIDSCGFESYGLACKECGIGLAGIIDPSDEKLLLTEVEGETPNASTLAPHSIFFRPSTRARSLG